MILGSYVPFLFFSVPKFLQIQISSSSMALAYQQSIKDAFELGVAVLTADSLSEKDIPKLKCSPGIDASKIFILEGKSIKDIVDPIIVKDFIQKKFTPKIKKDRKIKEVYSSYPSWFSS
jgi:hypothetical protein